MTSIRYSLELKLLENEHKMLQEVEVVVKRAPKNSQVKLSHHE